MTSIVVSSESQEGFVRQRIYNQSQALELARGGKYALVMPGSGAQAWWFWPPAPSRS